MKLWTLAQLARLPEAHAVQKHFDRINYRVLRWVWRFSVLLAVGFFVANSVDGELWGLGSSAVWLFALGAMYFARRSAFYESRFPRILPGFLLLSSLAMIVSAPDPEFRQVLPIAMLPMLLLCFRLPVAYCLALAAAFVFSAIVMGLTGFGPDLGPGETFVLPILTNSMFAAAGLVLTRQARRAFLEEWTGLASSAKERERMSDELADARKIQLSMLPGSAPAVDWLTIASASTPASEVGGDFYDHFVLDDGTVAIAIGDVAGHGVGSGLVLAGIKSGLHLLREELGRPLTVLERLNRLASEWLQWRMLVTLMIAIVDPRAQTVRVAAAGHAPVLVVSVDGSSRRVGRHALPLGTKLIPAWDEESSMLH
ncbi:MAG: SpoIIE family protein phosphatase, partial [Acidobacteria bacterium]|nr:SpoIIE family protein phosphatase [Acidobacteriota bacterium]